MINHVQIALNNHVQYTHTHTGAGIPAGTLAGRRSALLPGYLPGAVGGETGVGLLGGSPAQGEGTLPMVVSCNLIGQYLGYQAGIDDLGITN